MRKTRIQPEGLLKVYPKRDRFEFTPKRAHRCVLCTQHSAFIRLRALNTIENENEQHWIHKVQFLFQWWKRFSNGLLFVSRGIFFSSFYLLCTNCMDADDSYHNSIQINVNLRFASITFRMANILSRLCSKWVYKRSLNEFKLNNFNFFSCFSFLWSNHSDSWMHYALLFNWNAIFHFSLIFLWIVNGLTKRKIILCCCFFRFSFSGEKQRPNQCEKEEKKRMLSCLKAKLNIWLVNHK